MNYQLSTNNSSLPRPYAIAVSEQLEFVKLPKKEQIRILDLLNAFKTISRATCSKSEAITAISAVNAGRRGFSVESLDRLYRSYMKTYNWRVCVRNYRGANAGQPEEFKKFFCGLVLCSQGRTDVVMAARDNLIFNYWKVGKAVPGYGTFSEFWQRTQGAKPFPKIITDKPPHTPNWSYRTLCRIVKGTIRKEHRILASHGDLKAHDHQVQLFRDRTGLKPLQYVTFDDVELDIQVLCKIGNAYQIRPLQAVMALDIATAKFVAWGVRPMLKNEDLPFVPDDAGKVLTRKQVNSILMSMLINYGLPENYPIRLLMENASAALNTTDKQLIETLLPGRIVIEQTRMFSESYLGIECRKHGLPYQKGFIESAFQGIHTRISQLPGALAPRYELRNPAHSAIAEETLAVLKTAKAKGISETLLKFKLLTFDEFLPIFERIVDCWNNRTNHHLQGFDYEFETLVGSDFYRRDDAIKLLTSEELENAKFVRRMESPEERWQKLSAGVKITKVPVPALYPLMQSDKRIVSVRNGQIATEFSNISADKFYYRSPELAQYEGQEFIAITPDRETLWLFNKEEGFVCAVPRLDRVQIIDQTAIVRQSGFVQRERQREREKVEQFLADRKNTFKEIDVHNQAVLDNNAQLGSAMIEATQQKSQAKKMAQDTAIATLEQFSTQENDDTIDPFSRLEEFTENY